MVLRDVSTGAIETRILNLRNQKAKINKNSQETEKQNRRNEIEGKKALKVSS